MIKNPDFDTILKKYFWQENGRGRHAGAEEFRVSRPDQKVGPPGETFGPSVISKNVFEK